MLSTLCLGENIFFPNISPPAVRKGGGEAERCHALCDHRWYVVWSHVQTTSGLTEQEADEAELNNYLQAQECAIFTEYSRIIIPNI